MSSARVNTLVRQKRATSNSEPNNHHAIHAHHWHTSQSQSRSRSGDQSPRTGMGVPHGSRSGIPVRKSTSSSTVSPILMPTTLAHSKSSSGRVSPAIVLSPAPDFIFNIDDDLPSPDSLSPAPRSPDSPPLDTILSHNTISKEIQDIPKDMPRRGSLRTRTRAGTSTSIKSVEFRLDTPPACKYVPVETRPELRMDTDFSPDPVFGRASCKASPLLVKEAIVEPIGGFNIGNLRKDSYGKLPKISQPGAAKKQPDGQEVVFVESPGFGRVATPPEMDPSPMSTVILPAEPRRRHPPSRLPPIGMRGPPSVPFPSPAVLSGPIYPPTALVRDFVTGRQRSPRLVLMKSRSTTGLSPASVFAEHLVFTSPARNGSFSNLLHGGRPAVVRRLSGSVAASRESLISHLGEEGLRATMAALGRRASDPQPGQGRRSSAWAIGQGSLGLMVEGSGGVSGAGVLVV